MNLPEAWNAGAAVLASRWYLRGATFVGPRVRVWGKPIVRNEGRMVFEDKVRIVSTVVPVEFASGPGGSLEVGEGTYINYGCSIAASELVRIGPRCSIGNYVIIMDNDFHRLEPAERNEPAPSSPIVIEENVWIAARAIVLRGVRIGAHSVVGAGSVVTHDVPPRSLAAGVPARVVKTL